MHRTLGSWPAGLSQVMLVRGTVAALSSSASSRFEGVGKICRLVFSRAVCEGDVGDYVGRTLGFWSLTRRAGMAPM